MKMTFSMLRRLVWIAACREILNAQMALRYYLKRNPLEKPAFILSTERTGSTLLVSYLNSHPDVWFNGEALNPRFSGGLRRAFMTKKGALAHVRHFLNRSDLPLRGTKIFFWHLIMRGISLRDLYQAFPQAKWLILYRKNTLDQYLSLKIASKTLQWTKRKGSTSLEGATPKVSLFPRCARAYYKRMRRYYQSVLEVPEMNKNSIWISYEELAENPQDFFEEAVFPFLGLAPSILHTDMLKQNVLPKTDTIKNYEALKKELRDEDFILSYPRFPALAAEKNPSGKTNGPRV